VRVRASSTGRTGDPRAWEGARGAAGAFRQMPLMFECSESGGTGYSGHHGVHVHQPVVVPFRWPPSTTTCSASQYGPGESVLSWASSMLSAVFGLDLLEDADESLTLFWKHRHHLDDLSEDVCAPRASLDRLGGEPLSIRRVGYEPADQ
jgi:hypothetical protein